MAANSNRRSLTAIVGANIRVARLAAGETQNSLAVKLGTNPMAVSCWERSLYKPSDENLVALSDALGLPVAWFYTDHDAKQVAA